MKKTKMPGFLATHLPVHHYVKSVELQELQDNWKTRSEFLQFRQAFPKKMVYTLQMILQKRSLQDCPSNFTNTLTSGKQDNYNWLWAVSTSQLNIFPSLFLVNQLPMPHHTNLQITTQKSIQRNALIPHQRY